MALRFTVLASGSAGNASFVDAGRFGLLLDAGLGPRQIASRLKTIGASWRHVHAVLLTHTHGDHWNGRTLAQLRKQQIPLFCHPDHRAALAGACAAFDELDGDGLVRAYEPGQDFELAPGLGCRAFPVAHDEATFGFRLESREGLFGLPAVIAYAADLGSWTPDLVAHLSDADVLALEFNHDIDMEYASGRSPRLIQRVLGDFGHLSNCQAAALLHEVLRCSPPGRLQHVVQLHLSRQCNRPGRAVAAARAVLADRPEVELHTASQEEPGPALRIGELAPRRLPRRDNRKRSGSLAAVPVIGSQPWLPGLEPC